MLRVIPPRGLFTRRAGKKMCLAIPNVRNLRRFLWNKANNISAYVMLDEDRPIYGKVDTSFVSRRKYSNVLDTEH